MAVISEYRHDHGWLINYRRNLNDWKLYFGIAISLVVPQQLPPLQLIFEVTRKVTLLSNLVIGIEVAQSKSSIVISQPKYALNILEEMRMMEYRSIDTPMDPNAKLLAGKREPLSNSARYKRLVGKLNYLSLDLTSLFL